MRGLLCSILLLVIVALAVPAKACDRLVLPGGDVGIASFGHHGFQQQAFVRSAGYAAPYQVATLGVQVLEVAPVHVQQVAFVRARNNGCQSCVRSANVQVLNVQPARVSSRSVTRTRVRSR